MLDRSELNERLLHAVRERNTVRARRLIQRGADVDTPDVHGADDEECTPLYWAVRRNDVPMVRLLLKNRARIDRLTSQEDDTVLITAVYGGNLPIFKLLVGTPRARGRLLNRTNALGRTPVHVAVLAQRHEILEYLLSVGADYESADNDRFTPLALAGRAGDTRSVEVLLTKLPIDYWDNESRGRFWNAGGRTALHAAAENGQTKMVRELLRRGAYVRASDDSGWTPLHHAGLWNYADAAEELIAAGAQPWARDRSGLSPLAACASTCATDAMKIVLQALKTEFDREQSFATSEHRTEFRNEVNEALRETVRCKQLDVVQDSDRVRSKFDFLAGLSARRVPAISMLIDEGADPNSIGSDGTAREIAERNGLDEAIALFNEHHSKWAL